MRVILCSGFSWQNYLSTRNNVHEAYFFVIVQATSESKVTAGKSDGAS
jgi:hypothetical protein